MDISANNSKIYILPKQPADFIVQELERPRFLIVSLYELLIWDKFYYPFILITLVTFLFFIVWVADLSILTLSSIMLILVVIIDALSPLITENIYSGQKWDKSKQNKLMNFSMGIITMWNFFQSYYEFLLILRNKSSILFLSFLTIKFIFALWIGNFNNFILLYIKWQIFHTQ
ncbi:unnamed protein product [Gordionus sp. m RMFG-2023]